MNDFLDWCKAVNGTGYLYWIGDWIDTTANAGAFYCAVRADGGLRPNVDDRRARYSVVLLGRRDERADSKQLLETAQAMMLASIAGITPCGVAQIRALGEPMGPSVTTENRPWVKLAFEVTN